MKKVSVLCLLFAISWAYPEDYNNVPEVKPLYYYQQISAFLGPILSGFGSHAKDDNDNTSWQSMLEPISKVGEHASKWYDILVEHRDSHKFSEDPDSLLTNVVGSVKAKIQHCYADENKDTEENDHETLDPVAREFMVIVNGVNQLKELLQREGYMRDINKMQYIAPINMQNGGKDFWIFKLLESKAFLKIICGLMNVEWDILVGAFMAQL